MVPSTIRPAITMALLAVTLMLPNTVRGGMYGEHVVELTAANFDQHVMKTSETWLVKFYAPWCGHCQSSAPAFSKAAKKLQGVARLGVINCDEHKQIAGRFGVQGFPTIKLFKGDTPKARRPSDYNSARSAKAFVDHVKYVMPSYVARVKPSGLEAFFADLKPLPHVLLFTDKSSTSPLYKGLSATFKGKVACGEVRKTDGGSVASRFNIATYPTLLAFASGKTDPADATPFSGSMDPSTLTAFLSRVASADPAAGNTTGDASASGADGAAEAKEKVFEQPKAYSGEVVDITDGRVYTDTCGARKDGRMCALAFLPGGALHEAHAALQPAAQKYQYDNLAFAVIDSATEDGKAYAKAFGIDAGAEGFIVVRARKDKFTALEGAVESASIAALLDKVVGGDARWKKLGAALPEWKVAEKSEANGAGDVSEEIEEEQEGEPEDGDHEEADDESGQCSSEGDSEGQCGEGGEKDEL